MEISSPAIVGLKFLGLSNIYNPILDLLVLGQYYPFNDYKYFEFVMWLMKLCSRLITISSLTVERETTTCNLAFCFFFSSLRVVLFTYLTDQKSCFFHHFADENRDCILFF